MRTASAWTAGLGPRNLRYLTAVLVGVGALALAPAAAAQTYRPTRTGDPAPNGCRRDDCSLREALIRANNHPGKDEILLARKTYSLRIAPSGTGVNPRNGDLDITDPVVIKHPGRGRAVVDGRGVDRVFHQQTSDSDRYTRFARLVIRGGKASDWGGALLIGGGPIGLHDCVVVANRAIYDGGGIFGSSGELTLMGSTVRDNRAGFNGGGVASSVETTIRNSTLSGNTALGDGGGIGGDGGGLAIYGGELRIKNSTLTANRASGDGGAIFNLSEGILNNVTVARNRADSDNDGNGLGAGLRSEGSLTVANSIVAANRYGNGSISDCSGSYTSSGRNLLTGLVGCGGFATPPNILTADPRLGPLAANGGSTKTIALFGGSPAIGKAAKPSAEKRDQRGVLRDSHPDIGAFER